MFNINGKVALLTGGAGGIGQSIAKELLKHGLKGVSLVDIDTNKGQEAAKELEEEFGTGCAIFVKADITDEAQFTGAFEATIKKFKQLDIVVNNAGILQEIEWHKCIAINLEGVILGSKLAIDNFLTQFKSGDEGVLVNMASGLGIIPLEGVPVYVATKHAVVGFSRSIGGPTHYQNYKVRVVAVCPGLTNTDLLALREDQQVDPFRTIFNDIVKDNPIQSTEELAQNVVKLIQEAASGSVWQVTAGILKQAAFPTIDE